MELKIADPASITLSGQFGITDLRIEELCTKLDHLARKYFNDQKTVSKSQVFTEIASFCDTVEELILCIHGYDGFMFENFEQIGINEIG